MAFISQHADEVLQGLHKRRSTPACYPCYKRKVRCEGGRPCLACIERKHEEICNDDGGPRKRPKKTLGDSNGATLLLNKVSTAQADAQGSISPNRSHASLSLDVASQTPHSGEFSAVDYVRRRLHDTRKLLREDLKPDGIPDFVNLQGDKVTTTTPQHRQLQRLADVLPRPDEIFRFLTPFRDLVMRLYPIVSDLAALESCIYTLLAGKTDSVSNPQLGNDLIEGEVNEAQAAMILACLALGCQFAEIDAATRQDVSQDLVNRSNKCLQEANYTLNPSVEVVQALLLIGLAQQNLEQSDAAWVLLGLTHRIAQTLGLDLPQTSSENDSTGSRCHPLWQAILWQDALLCLRYDRKLLSYDIVTGVPDVARSPRRNLSYANTMNRVCSITRELLQETASEPDSVRKRIQLLNRIEDILSRTCDYLRNGKLARTFQQRTEYLLLKLHSSFLSAEICRPGLTGSAINHSQRQLRTEGTQHLQICLQSFIDLCRFSRFPLRSWSITQAAVSSALFLALLLPQLHDHSVAVQLREVSEALWIDTSPPFAPNEVRKPCVGLSVTRMKASRLLAHILDQTDKGPSEVSANQTKDTAPVSSTETRDVCAATQDIMDWPLDFSLFDPTFAANVLDFDLEQEWSEMAIKL